MSQQLVTAPPPSVELRNFRIFGLHGKHDVSLSFAGRTTIFIADNGAGKTTSLYFLQAVLSGQFSKLTRFVYNRIEISFSDGIEFKITPHDYGFSREAAAIRSIISNTDLSPKDISFLASQARRVPYEVLREKSMLVSASRQIRVPPKILYEKILRLNYSKEHEADLISQVENSPIIAIKEYLSRHFAVDVIYLPTYRRVEQAIERIFQTEGVREDLKGSDIHFGMKDVAAKIDAATNQIREHFLRSYGQISGQMLGQLAESKAISVEMQNRLADRKRVELVLRRVGQNVSEHQRSVIMEQFDSGLLLDNRHLAFFLSRLIEAYEEVKGVDDDLQSYAKVCNGYLINKEMKYDSLNGTLKLYESVTEDEIKLEHLSSGEKQILGAMADIYLGNGRRLAVVFDEPELSLSVEWQKKILVDMVASERCAMLVAATHSPFLFDNDLDSCARPLKVLFNPNRSAEGSDDHS